MKTQIKRSTTNKVVAGVAGGVADAFGWDPTLVRLGFILLTVLHGGGLLLYIVLLLLMPKAEQSSGVHQAVVDGPQVGYRLPGIDRNRTLGYALLGVETIILASTLHISGPLIALGSPALAFTCCASRKLRIC